MVPTNLQCDMQGFGLPCVILHSEAKACGTLVSKVHGRARSNPIHSRSRLHLHPHQLRVLQEAQGSTCLAGTDESRRDTNQVSFSEVAVKSRNRQIVSLLQLAEQSSDRELIQQLNTLMKQDGVALNQKVRSEQIMICTLHLINGVVGGSNHNERGVIAILREMAATDRFLTDPSVVDALKQFCISFALWPRFILGIPPGNSTPSLSAATSAASVTSPSGRRQSSRWIASASSPAWIRSRV